MLGFKSYSTLNIIKSVFNRIDEGINFSIDPESNIHSIDVDYNNDSDDDVVKLANVSPTRDSRMAGIQSWVGYNLEDPIVDGNRIKNYFSEWVKTWNSFSDSELEELINHSFPDDLKKKNIKIIFVMGSSSPLSSRIADALKKMYFKDAKIIDIMKAYYGVDKKDIINWDEYEKAGEVQKKQIDSYLRGLTSFDGYIKKGGRLQTGQTRDKILKPGHYVDDYIIDNISRELRDWSDSAKGETNIKALMSRVPNFLTVDDIVVQGSTIKRALTQVIKSLYKPSVGLPGHLLSIARSNINAYSLFSYSNRFKPSKKEE